MGPPDVALPAHHELLLDRGFYTRDGEFALLDAHVIDVVVTKDSGNWLLATPTSLGQLDNPSVEADEEVPSLGRFPVDGSVSR